MNDRRALEAGYARTLLPLSRLWRQSADRALGGMGVSASIGWALVQLSRLGSDMRQTDLAAAMDITGASLVRLLNAMATAGLIHRRRDADDARVSQIGLTEAGQALATRIEAALEMLRVEALADIPDDDLAAALRVARHLEAWSAASRRR